MSLALPGSCRKACIQGILGRGRLGDEYLGV